MHLCFVAVFALCSVNAAFAWKETSKACAAGCESVGNCNKELGVCECPFGRQGPACEQHVLGACRTSTDEKALPFYGLALPKSCACWKQLLQYAGGPATVRPYLESVLKWEQWRVCYERKGLPDSQQFSDPPEVTDPNIRWRKPRHPQHPDPFADMDSPPKQLHFNGMFSGESFVAMPNNKCPDRCNERGVCLQGHCRCMQGFHGSSCEQQHPDAKGCLNKCGGRGKCMGGFCHCPPGYWGMDCTRSKAFEPDPARPLEVKGDGYSRTKLRIYRYELPWNIAFYMSYDDTISPDGHPHEGYNKLYGAFEEFFNLFSSDTAVRTENPHEANLFYIPLLEFMRDDNAGDVHEYTKRAMHFIKATYPHFWSRNEGKDHFLWLPGDLGACWLLDQPEVQNPIKVVHWGLQVGASQYVNIPHYWWVVKQPVNKQYHCFKVEKDVVAPCWMDDHKHELSQAEVVYKQALNSEKRRFLLFFGGGIRHEQKEYSGGARQAFDKHVVSKNHPEVIFGGGREKYREATFCLAPYGDGWGSRLVHILQGACIPVIIQEHVHQPFDDVLQYEDFSLTLQVSDVPQLLHILKSVTQDQIQAYRQKMYEVHKAFSWHPVHGGLAYNYTLMSLRRKLVNLWSMHY